MTVPRDYSISEFSLKDQFVPTTGATGTESSFSTNQLLQGATQRTSTAFGRTATVKAGEDIQPALQSLKSVGGGTLILLAGVHTLKDDIIGSSNLSIVGEGIDQTILDCGNAGNSIIYSNSATGFKLSSFTIRNSTSHGLYFNSCTNFELNAIESINNGNQGFYIYACSNFRINGCIAESNGDVGYYLYGSSNFRISGSTAESNGAQGFYAFVNSGESKNFDIESCVATSNVASGFYLGTNGTGLMYNFTVIGCRGSSNGVTNITTFSGGTATTKTYNYVVMAFHSSSPASGQYGLKLAGLRYTVVACMQDVGALFITAQTDGITGPATVTGCTGVGQLRIDHNVSAFGNTVDVSTTTDPLAQVNAYDEGFDSIIIGTTGGTAVTEKKIYRMKNATGSTINFGQLVILSAVASGNEIEQTTTVGHDRVFGMVLTAIPTGEWGPVQVEGFTHQLHVNGTTDIAIGDFLTTYSVAGIAAKAVAGDMAIAIALEAYTNNDSSGTLNALLISPRKL